MSGQLSRNAAEYDWLWLLALAPALLYADRLPPLVVAAALSVYLLLWFVRWRATGQLITRTPLDIPILCLLFTVPLSMYAAPNVATSLPRLTGLVLGVGLYYSFVRLSAQPARLPLAISLWLLSAFAIALLGLFGADWTTVKFSTLNPLTTLMPRLVSGLGTHADRGLHPNVIGGTLALFIAPLLSALWSRGAREESATAPARTSRFDGRAWLYPERRRARWVWLAALVLLSGLLVLTQSRSALFGVALALALFGALRSRTLRWLSLVALIALGIAAFSIGPNRMGEIWLGTGGVPAVGSLDFAGREEVWGRALYTLQDFPITGVGLGQFEQLLKKLYPLLIEGVDAEVPHAHNIYLQVGVDFGVGGLVAYAALLISASVLAVRAYLRLPATLTRRLLLGFALGLLAYQVFGLTDAVALGTKPSFEWWLNLSVIAGIAMQSEPPRAARISALEVIILWLLCSALAVANLVYDARLGFALAIIGGGAVGVAAILNARAPRTAVTSS